jgi:hypothetical protein
MIPVFRICVLCFLVCAVPSRSITGKVCVGSEMLTLNAIKFVGFFFEEIATLCFET